MSFTESARAAVSTAPTAGIPIVSRRLAIGATATRTLPGTPSGGAAVRITLSNTCIRDCIERRVEDIAWRASYALTLSTVKRIGGDVDVIRIGATSSAA